MYDSPAPEALVVMNKATWETQFTRDRLQRLGELVTLGDPVWTDDLDDPALADRLPRIDLLITSWGAPRLTADLLERLPRLSAVFHCAGSIRSLVSDAFWQRGISIANAADSNAVPVAEFALAAIVFGGKKAPFLAADARRHRDDWSYATARGHASNYGTTVGVIGFSRVGRRVVRLVQSLESVRCLVADPYADADEVATAGGELVPLEQLLHESDTVSVHAPELPSTRHMIGEKQLALMPNFATLINTARGSLIDTKALERECSSGRLNAILDVTDPEPLPAESPLYSLPNVMITPHIAGSLGSETLRMTDSVLDDLTRYVQGRKPMNSVSREALVTNA